MSEKVFFVLSLHALLIKVIVSQCLPSRELNFGCGSLPGSLAGINNYNPAACVTNQNFPVSPASFLQPVGVSISADNLIIDGYLDVAGRLPFLGTVLVDGAVANVGQAGVLYGCGNGNVGIINEASLGVPSVLEIVRGYNGGGYGCV